MLGVWAWGVLTMMRVTTGQSGKHHGEHNRGTIVFLDREKDDGVDETPDVQRWVESGQGRPALTRGGAAQREDGTTASSSSIDAKRSHVTTSDPSDGEACFLGDPKACIRLAREVLRANFVGVWETMPPLNENILDTIAQLEKAAAKLGG